MAHKKHKKASHIKKKNEKSSKHIKVKKLTDHPAARTSHISPSKNMSKKYTDQI